MNYELEIQKSNPAVFNNLNGTKPPLVAGAGSSTILSAVSNMTFVSYAQNTENIEFTLETWYLPIVIAASSEIVVIGHSNEGVLFDGKDFILRMKFSDATQIEGRWTPSQAQSFHVVAVYNVTHFFLYINGDLKISLDVPSDKLLAYTGTNISLNALSAGTGSGWYDSAALYYRALASVDIVQHYNNGLNLLSSVQSAAAYGASTFLLTYDNVEALQSITFNSSNWSSGYGIGVSYSDTLTADIGGGEWNTSVPLESVSPTTTAGVNLEYVGQLVTLQYSTDGTTWNTVTNNTTILQDVSTVGLMLYIKLIVADGGYVESLEIDILASRILQAFSGKRPVSFFNVALDRTPGHQLEYQYDQGAQIRNGYLAIQPDASGAITNIASVELWAKLDDSVGVLLDNSTGSVSVAVDGTYTFTGITAYRNGVLVSNGSYGRDEFAHWVFVFTTANNGEIRIGNNLAGTSALDMTVGHLAFYDYALIAGQVAALYNSNIGAAALQIIDNGTVTVTETIPATDIYAYTWTK
jgi:phage tail protein X